MTAASFRYLTAAMKTIFSKLLLLITAIIVVALSVTGFFILEQKRRELNQDIFENAVNYAELTAPAIVKAYTNFYLEGNFLKFSGELNKYLPLNNDVTNIMISDYDGTVLFNEIQENQAQWRQGNRVLTNSTLLQRLQDIKPSVITKADHRIVYLPKNEDGSLKYVTANEEPTAEIKNTDQIDNIVVSANPHGDNQLKVIYEVSYANLDQRIINTRNNIILFLILTSLLGVLAAIIFSRKLTHPIKTLTAGAAKIAQGQLQTQVTVHSHDEIKTLADTFNQMAKDLEKNTQLLLEKERLSKELEVAQGIQQRLLPATIPTLGGLDIATSSATATEVGGDIYDFIKVNDYLTFSYIADVTGHGIPASLIASLTSAMMYAYAQEFTSPRDVLIHVNRTLHAKTNEDMFVTMALLAWDAQSKLFRYAMAGHDQLILYRAATQKVQLLPKGGMPLGMLADNSAVIQEETLELFPGDVLIAYTDGLPEAWHDTQILGMEQLLTLVEQFSKLDSAQAIHDAIRQAITDFTAGTEAKDDSTLIVYRRL